MYPFCDYSSIVILLSTPTTVKQIQKYFVKGKISKISLILN